MAKPKQSVMDEIRQGTKRNKETKMTTFKNIDWNKVWTITKTLLFVAWTAAAVLAGMNYNQSINNRIHAEAKTLTQVSVATESKN